MTDPISTFGLSLLGGYVANMTTAAAMEGLRRLNRRLDNASRMEKLPANRHIERGTSRASLMATQICIQQLIETGRETFLDDIAQAVRFEGELTERSHRDPSGDIAARSALQKKLHELIEVLEPQDGHKSGRRKQKRFKHALEEAALSISKSQLDRCGGNIFSKLNNPPAESGQVPKLLSIQQVRHEILPNLKEMVVNKILHLGKWEISRHEAIAEGICARFFGEDELWVKKFALCYADEISQDEHLFRMAAFLRLEKIDDALSIIETGGETLQREVDAFAQEARKTLGELSHTVKGTLEASLRAAQAAESVLAYLSSEMVFKGQKIFYSPSFGKQAGSSSTFRSFHFAEEEDAFTGRDDILAQLHNSLLILHKDVPQFRWAAICGGAGTGKSRLALHILQHYIATWRLSGFVRKHFITKQTLDSLSGISGPTLFIIDYAGSAPEACCRFIEQCALLAEDAPFPVRVIVLLRRSNDRFFEYIREKEDGAIALKTQADDFPPPKEHSADKSGALFLTELKTEETLELMRKRIALTAKIAGPDVGSTSEKEASDEKLLSLLHYYDESGRPLFALMVADAFQKGLVSARPAEAAQEEARLTLFSHYLEHQFNKQWKHAHGKGESPDDAHTDRHITFLILSTMCRGLMDEGWLRLYDEPVLSNVANKAIPHSPNIYKDGYGSDSDLLNKTLLMALSSSQRVDTEDSYPIIEPDLIGEALVLLVFDQERGKDFCLRDETLARRKDYLCDFSWTADPEGAAFFSILVAQDYPEHAVKLGWLLPKEKTSNATDVRVKLFRNLVSVTVEKFRYRAATRDDVEQIKKLIETFRPKPSDSEEIQREFLIGLVALAEQLMFMVNKYAEPKDTVPPPALEDKQDKQQLEFSRAATASHSKPAEKTDVSPPNDEAIYQHRSDSEAIDAALSLLRRLYDESVESVFLHNALDIRVQHSYIIGKVLGSVFWKFRNKEKQFGFAASPPSKEEITERDRLANLCSSKLTASNVDEDTLSVVCYLVHSIIFAEHGENKTRGRKVFEAICEKISTGDFTKETSIELVLNFITNHAFNEINFEINNKEKSERCDLSVLRETTETLVRLAIRLPSLTKQGRESIASSFLNICDRLAGFDEQCHRPMTKYMDGNIALFMEFIDRHGTVPVGDKALDFFSEQFKAYRQLNKDATNALTRYSDLVTGSCFDRWSLSRPSWENLRYHLLQLAYMPSESLGIVNQLIKTLIEQIGSRANRDLVDMLQHQLPDAQLMPESVETLAELGCDCSEEIVAADKRSNLNLALMSQQLLYGDDEVGFIALGKRWTIGDNDEDFIARTEIFHHLQMLIWWHGLEHKKIREWRQRLLKFFNAAPPATEEKIDSISHSHHQAAIATAETFAQLEIAAGLSPDDWLLLKENR